VQVVSDHQLGLRRAKDYAKDYVCLISHPYHSGQEQYPESAPLTWNPSLVSQKAFDL